MHEPSVRVQGVKRLARKHGVPVYYSAGTGRGLRKPVAAQGLLVDGERLVLDGLYTVSLDALHELPDTQVLALFRDGTLHLAYAQAQSVGHLRTLAQRRNERLASGFGGCAGRSADSMPSQFPMPRRSQRRRCGLIQPRVDCE